MAFTEPDRILRLAKTHRLVARKVALLIDAYTGLDARMTDVFRRLGFGTIVDALPELTPQELRISPSSIPPGRPGKPD